MRKWHRWLSLLFGIFGLWIAVTGVLSQVPIWNEQFGGKDEAAEAAAAKAAIPEGFVCPDTMTCRPKKKPSGGLNVGLLHHLHSGEEFGPVGTVVMTLSGLAMVFFAFSGIWMYVSMWRNRAAKSLKPGWFWK